MTREQFRLKLMREKTETEECLVDMCVLVQKELCVWDADKILDMNVNRFDAICSSLDRIYKRSKGKGGKSDKGVGLLG